LNYFFVCDTDYRKIEASLTIVYWAIAMPRIQKAVFRLFEAFI
jgi:hypothetical protein